MKPYLLTAIFCSCLASMWAGPDAPAMNSGLLRLSGFVQRFGPPTKRVADGSESQNWYTKDSSISVWTDGDSVGGLLIVVGSHRNVPSTAKSALEREAWAYPGSEWIEKPDSPRAKPGSTIFVTPDGRLECEVKITKDITAWDYYVLIRDLTSKAGQYESKQANQPPRGPPGKVPSSSTEQEARRP